MRTTITIDDELYRQVQEKVARTGRTVSDLVQDALRRPLSESGTEPRETLLPLPTYGGSGALPGVDLTSNTALRDDMDADEALDALD